MFRVDYEFAKDMIRDLVLEIKKLEDELERVKNALSEVHYKYDQLELEIYDLKQKENRKIELEKEA